MSDETAPETGEQTAAEDEAPSRVSGVLVLLLLAGVVVLVLRVIVSVAPYTAYFVAGVLVTVGWQRVGGWIRRRREDIEEEAEEELPDIAEALRHLGRRGDSVLLTQLRKRLGVADTKAVKALLKAEKIRWRSGVRTPAGNGPGVHHEDIPAAPPEVNGEHADGCCCRSANNTNANNAPEQGPEEGLRVVPIGTDGKIIYDPKDTIRYHRVQ